MAGKIQLNRITNANVYIDGNCLLGRVEEIKLPDISVTMTEHKALGMVGKIELPSGFDKMEGEIKWNSFYEDAFAKVVDPFTAIALMVRANVETYDSTGRAKQVPLVTNLTVMFKKNPLGTYKQNDNAEFSSAFTAYYFKTVCDGKDIVELDVLANIYKVNGKDALDIYRSNIGG